MLDEQRDSVEDAQPQTIKLSEAAWEQFMAALDDPPEPNEDLKKLMREFGPWKDGARVKSKSKK